MNFGILQNSISSDEREKQIVEISAYAALHGFSIDIYDEYSVVNSLINKIEKNDTIFMTQLPLLGRGVAAVLNFLKELIIDKMCEVHIVKYNLILNLDKHNQANTKLAITIIDMLLELEKNIISKRTKDALKIRADNGIKLGKPKGTVQSSQYDKDYKKIIELIELGVPIKKITEKHLGYGTRQSLAFYLERKSIRVNLRAKV